MAINELGWDQKFSEMKQHLQTAGGLELSHKGATRNLYFWALYQRVLFNKGELLPNRRDKLDAIGFSWDAYEDAWTGNLEAYIDFFAKHGRGDVAFIKRHDVALSTWVNRHKSFMGTPALDPVRESRLIAAGITASTPASRRSRADIELAQELTLLDLALYVAAHGHAKLDRSSDPNSLFCKIQELKNLVRRRPHPELNQSLRTLGAFEQYVEMDWENQFVAWKRYAAATGDFAAIDQPSAAVREWASSLRNDLLSLEFDSLSAPLTARYPRNRSKAVKRFREQLQRCRSTRMIASRVLQAGFVVTVYPLQERDFLRTKIAGICGIQGASALKLRCVLRVAASRAQKGTLTPASFVELKKLGLVWTNDKWRDFGRAHRIPGEKITSPLSVLVGKRLSGAKIVRVSAPAPYSGLWG